MISWDLHIHTHHSHARDSVQAMHSRACELGLTVMAFTEHSPRPEGYDYPSEYRERLHRGLPLYVEEVRAIQQAGGPVRVLLGMEIDWIAAEPDFVRQAATAWPYELLLGSVHFLDQWGFDADQKDWDCLDEPARGLKYAQYFCELERMAKSGLFHIAAHLDIIKLFSVHSFHDWLTTGDNLDLVRNALCAVRDQGMTMEISSAGLRKACAEIYPGPTIMRLAADLGVAISFASDAHTTEQMAWNFAELARYAHSFAYHSCLVPLGKGDWKSYTFA